MVITDILLTVWNLAALAVLLGPLGWVVTKWEREDRELWRELARRGRPFGRSTRRTQARRWVIGIAVVLASSPIAATMFNAADGLGRVLIRVAPF